MKQKIEYVKGQEKNENLPSKFSKTKNGLILVFSLCISSLSMLFSLSDTSPPRYEEKSEIISVFKQTYLYDFLDLDNCENTENIEGSV